MGRIILAIVGALVGLIIVGLILFFLVTRVLTGFLPRVSVTTPPTVTTNPFFSPTPIINLLNPSTKQFNVSASGNAYNPASISINRGDQVQLTFTNNTQSAANLRLDEFNGASTRILNPGESATITFTADKSGTYQYYSSVGDSRSRGFVGTLIVM